MSDDADFKTFDEAHPADKPPAEVLPDPVENKELTASDRLRAFEDEKVGADAVRINGRIERGSGSFFQTRLTDEDRKHHAALEKLIETEQALTDAKVALVNAENAHAEALDKVDAS